jgi:hypothetical protein
MFTIKNLSPGTLSPFYYFALTKQTLPGRIEKLAVK